MQSSARGTGAAQPEVAAVAAVATGDPVVLSGVAYTEGDLPTPPGPDGPPPTSDVVAAPALAPEPVVASTPVESTLFAAPATPPADPPPVPATTADGFPNINIPPRQPGGQLLTPEERAKLIAELNALAGRPAGAE